eukprot:gene28215-42443_t
MDAQRGMPPPPQAQQHAGYSQQQQYPAAIPTCKTQRTCMVKLITRDNGP